MKYINIERIKEVLAKVNNKKSIIENNYFQSLRIFNDMLKIDPNNNELVSEIAKRKENLDESVNSTISYLDNLTRALSLVMYKVIQNKDLLKQHEDEFLITPPITSDNLSVENEYEKELRNSPDGESLVFDSLAQDSKELSFNFSEFNDVVDKINKEFEYSSPNDVKQGLLNDQEYTFEDKINKLEQNLKKEIEAISTHNEMLEQQNTNLQNMLIKLEEKDMVNSSSLYNKRNWDNSELYFSALDKSVNSAVSKFDEVSEKMATAINFLSINQIESLEKISLPLIRSLETSLKTVTQDFEHIKKENEHFKKEIDSYKETILALKNDSKAKEYELKNSYDSWLSNVRKIGELEDIINEQSDDIKKVYEEKNDLIIKLEEKISETGNFVNQIVYEKELLLQQNSDLVFEIDRLKRELAGETEFDEYINSVSIQDIVQKEAEKIVEDKINNLMKRYKEEVEKIKGESISYFLNARDNDERVLSKLIEENNTIPNEIAKTVEKLEKKLSSLESNLKFENEIKERTQDSINDINLLLGQGPYPMIEQEKSFLTNKFDKLEQRIEESLERVKTLEDQKLNTSNEKIDDDKLDELFSKSPLYEDFNQRLLGKEIEIEALKSENYRINEENQVINNILNETIQKVTINSGKMREIEELLEKQDYEITTLNDEKNSVIDALYNAIRNRDLTEIDDINDLKKLDKYDFSNFAKKTLSNRDYESDNLLDYVKEQVEKIISNEIESLRNKYDEELKNINEKYEFAANPDILTKTFNSEENKTLNHVNQNGVAPIYQVIQTVPNFNIEPLDDSYFNIEKNDALKEILDEYLNSDNEIDEEVYEEEIIEDDDELEKLSEYIGENGNLLDVSIDDNSPWNPSKKIKPSSKKIIHKTTSSKFKKEEELIKKLLERNDDLESKIKNLQNVINDKFISEIKKNKDYIEISKYKTEFIPPIYDYPPASNHNYMEEIKKDLLSQQLNQSKEIDKKINDSINEFKLDNDRQLEILNRKIDSINQTNTFVEVDTPVFENRYDDRNNLYLEREIISSTDKLLQLQKELLTLESELSNEEKKIIVDL